MRPRRASQIADRLTDRLMVQGVPLYRDAVRAELMGNGGTAAWSQLQALLTRQSLAAALLGRAAQARTLVRQRLIDAPAQDPIRSLDPFAQFDDDDDIANRSLRESLLEIVNHFVGDVPDLGSIAPGMVAEANEQARRIVTAARDDAPRLVRQLVARAPEVPATVPATIPDPSVTLIRMLDRDDGAALLSRTLETETRTAMMSGFNRGGRAETLRHQDVLPITVLDEIQDRRTRGNPRGLYPDAGMHYQMDGFMAATDDPVWDRITPPNGYNCRATTRGVSRAKAKQNKHLRDDGSVDREALRRRFARQWRIIESGQYPDPGFG